jgi:hypothetical protein
MGARYIASRGLATSTLAAVPIAIWLGSTGSGRNPIFNGRRQPSCGGTSRMTRECQVRICERLGVKFPGAYSAKAGQSICDGMSAAGGSGNAGVEEAFGFWLRSAAPKRS